jgi:hypothetical protein
VKAPVVVEPVVSSDNDDDGGDEDYVGDDSDLNDVFGLPKSQQKGKRAVIELDSSSDGDMSMDTDDMLKIATPPRRAKKKAPARKTCGRKRKAAAPLNGDGDDDDDSSDEEESEAEVIKKVKKEAIKFKRVPVPAAPKKAGSPRWVRIPRR